MGDRQATKAHLAYQVDDLAAWRTHLENLAFQISEAVHPGSATL
ncbi:MAG TPA: hypothetical protein VGF67_31445 [Ktedonobacteraceae bacterium]